MNALTGHSHDIEVIEASAAGSDSEHHRDQCAHLIGYARVSSGSQDTTVQEAMLRAAGCAVVRTEKVSGRSREGRGELEALMDFIRPGNSLVVAKLDRLGRSTRDVLNLVHELEQKGANLRVLEPAIDTGGPMGKMVLIVLGVVAEMELSFLKERQRAGMALSRPAAIFRSTVSTESEPVATHLLGQ